MNSVLTKSVRFGAVALIGLLAACGKDKAESGSAADKMRVALLTPGPISDKSWNGSAYEGLLALRDSLGAEVSHIQTKTPAEFEENFRQYGAQGYRLVFGHGFEFQDAASRVAPSYPKTIYVVTSGRVTGPNLAGVAFLFEEASYQAGMIAGAVTKTNKLGLIAGTELPPVKASFEAFARGARAVNPKVEVITSYIGNWDDVSAGKEQALAQLARGVDVIFQNADAAGLGVFQAVKEKKALAFGTNANQNDVAPDVIIGSVVIDLPKAFMLIGREVQSGAFTGRVISLGVKDDVVRLELNPALADRIPAAARAAVDSVDALLKAGTFHALSDVLEGADAPRQTSVTPGQASTPPSTPPAP
ncbi:BMP family protein [Gemmatimonas aurantiaca]|uniref:BMP family protein n=1 Tax=Gemmatimonas aurantiaca TaxID=173480 RepID=UPI00301CA636